jgi:hypothetical protein
LEVDVEGLLSLLFLCALVSLFSLIPKRTRRPAKYTLPLSVIGFIVVAGVYAGRLDEEARGKGFVDMKDYKAAEKAGVNDASVWSAMREATKQEERRQATQAAEAKARQDAEEEERRRARWEEERRVAEEASREKARLARLEEDRCKGDLTCWAEKHMPAGSVYCRSLVERLAKNDFQWFDGFLEPKFSHYRWADKDRGLITYIGDRIKYQNGFGAWIIHTYECDFDPGTKQPVTVRATPGQLPR